MEEHFALASPAPRFVIDNLTAWATYALAVVSEWNTE